MEGAVFVTGSFNIETYCFVNTPPRELMSVCQLIETITGSDK